MAKRQNLTAGVLLIMLGGVLLLHALDLLPDRVLLRFFWTVPFVLGAFLVVRGWTSRSSFTLFAGAFFAVAGIHAALWSFGILEPRIEECVAAFLLWIGIASLLVWLPTPYKADLLIPVFLFGGCGLAYYLWWWEVFPLNEITGIPSRFWPVLIVLLGAGIILRSLHKRRGHMA